MGISRFSSRILIVVAAFGLAAETHASLVEINVVVPKVVLKSGISYADLTIKTFDPAIGRVMVLQGKTFTTLSITDFPDDLAAKLKAMTPASAAEPEKPSTILPAPVVAAPVAPEVKEKKDHAEVDQPAMEKKAMEKAKAVAKARADNYFRYEFRYGSNSVTLRSLKIEWDEPEAVSGWVGRYRLSGKAYIDYFDSVGDSFGRTTQAFEISTEPDSHGTVKVVDLTMK